MKEARESGDQRLIHCIGEVALVWTLFILRPFVEALALLFLIVPREAFRMCLAWSCQAVAISFAVAAAVASFVVWKCLRPAAHP